MNMFADDAKLLRRIRTAKCCQELQEDLNKLADWTAMWLITFNAAKCSVMNMGNSVYRPKFQYILDGTKLKTSVGEKDLGVLVSPNMSPEKHIASVVRSAYATLANIRIAFKHMDVDMFRVIYPTYVRPKLEYAVQFWSPHIKWHVQKLEKVQRHATKLVPELRGLSYEDRLIRIGIPTLKERRDRGDMITVFKYLKGFNNVNSDNHFERSNCTTTRGHSLKLKKQIVNKDVSKYFFSNRVVDRWNSLDEETVQAETIASFKSKYDRSKLSNLSARTVNEGQVMPAFEEMSGNLSQDYEDVPNQND